MIKKEMGISVLAFRGMDVSRSQLVTELTNIYRDDKMSSDLKQSPSFLFMVRPAAFGFNTETGVSRYLLLWITVNTSKYELNNYFPGEQQLPRQLSKLIALI